MVDPVVSRAKFNREITAFRQQEREYAGRGWWLLRAEFPEVFVVLATNKTQPPAVVFGVLIDFTNYDLWPPSVTLVNPFTRVPYKAKELPNPLIRRVPVAHPAPTNAPTGDAPPTAPGATATTPGQPMATAGVAAPQAPQFAPQPLMQWWGEEEVPFLCLPGVREYHENPAHTGDSWLLHRRTGAGTLYFILDQIDRYGVQPVRFGIQVVSLQANVSFQANFEEVPT